MSDGFERRSHGLYGSEIIDDTNPHTGDWSHFQVLETAVLAASVGPVVNEVGRAAIVALAEGTIHWGPFTSLTLTSGIIQAFNLNRPAS